MTEERNPRNKNLWLVVVIALSVLVLLFSGMGGGSQSRKAEPDGESNNKLPAAGSAESRSELLQAERQMEEQLKSILAQIAGAGEVEVKVALDSGPRYQYGINQDMIERKIEEQDQSGGARTTTEMTVSDKMVLLKGAAVAGEQPVVVKEIRPEVRGVLVVATGAGNPLVRERLIRSVETVLGVATHQVEVLPKRESERK